MSKNTHYFLGVLIDASKNPLNAMQFTKHGANYFYRYGTSTMPWNFKKANKVIPVSDLKAEIQEAKEEMRNRGLTVPGVIVK